jgi:uncharacterized membrane protein
MTEQPGWNDNRIETIIASLLRFGVLLSIAIVFVGGSYFLLTTHSTPHDQQVFHGEPESLCSVSGILRRAATLDARGIIQLGLLVLIATPVARVIFSVYAFEREHDRLYVFITLLVLGLLLYSLFLGSIHEQPQKDQQAAQAAAAHA